MLSIHSESLWSARQHPSWNYWLALWFGFEGQICCSWLGQILSGPLANLTALAAKLLTVLGTTYLCEHIFSAMSINKRKLRSRLTHNHLNHILKLVVTQNVTPMPGIRSQINNATPLKVLHETPSYSSVIWETGLWISEDCVFFLSSEFSNDLKWFMINIVGVFALFWMHCPQASALCEFVAMRRCYCF